MNPLIITAISLGTLGLILFFCYLQMKKDNKKEQIQQELEELLKRYE